MLQELMPIYSKDGTCQTIKEYVERYGDAEIDGIKQDIEDLKVDKVDKVENAVEGDVAGLTASGNIFDTGISLYGEKTYDYAEVLNIKNALPVPAVDCKVNVKPIQAGSGTPSPDNIRPISGITELKILRTGENIAQEPQGNGVFASNTGQFYESDKYAYSIANVKPNTQYTASLGALGSGTSVIFYNDDPSTNPQIKYIDGIDIDVRTYTFTTPSNCKFVVIETGGGQTPITPSSVGYIHVEPTTTTTIPLPSTLYDGDVDVTDGSGDSRYGYIASYNGETLPGAWISDRDVYTGSNSPTTGAEVAYELATPTTISFTPADVELLEGTNVVSANTGDISMTVKYDRLADLEDRVTALENA